MVCVEVAGFNTRPVLAAAIFFLSGGREDVDHEPRGKIRRVTAQLLDRFLSVGLCLCWQEEQ